MRARLKDQKLALIMPNTRGHDQSSASETNSATDGVQPPLGSFSVPSGVNVPRQNVDKLIGLGYLREYLNRL
jgi:hypothetical protein